MEIEKKIKYFLNEPFLREKEKEYVLDVLNSSWLSVRGKHTKIFEEKFAEMVGTKYALAVQSGTAALHTALLALGIKKGDKVAIPNYTCGGDATSIIQCGAEPVIIDVEKDTFGMDSEKLKELIKHEKLKAVILVHVYGFPARDTEKIDELCKENNILLVEDCCEAHNARLGGRTLGTFGDISVFSVRSEKMIGVGEGGMILTNNKQLNDNAYYWASRAAPFRRSQDPYWYAYYYTDVGMNYLMPHLLGAVGRAQIENFPEILRRKKEVGKTYQESLSKSEGIELQKIIEGSDPVFWLNMILFKNKNEGQVHEIGKKLIEKGVEIRPGFWPLGDHPPFRSFTYGNQEIGHWIFEHGIILPSSVYLADENCKGVREVVNLLFDVINQQP